MNRYVYTDHKQKQVLLECDAADILAADKIFKEKYPDIELIKCPWIGIWSPNWNTSPEASAAYWSTTQVLRS